MTQVVAFFFSFVCISLLFSSKAYFLFLPSLLVFYVSFRELSVRDSLFTILLTLLPFERSFRSWDIVVSKVDRSVYGTGFEEFAFFFGISGKAIIVAALLLILVVGVFAKRDQLVQGFLSKHARRTLYILSLFLVSAVISSFWTSNFNIAFFGLVRLCVSLAIFAIGVHFFKRREVRNHYIYFLLASLLFFGILGTAQLMLGGPVGLSVEDSKFITQSQFVTTDGEAIPRISGQTGHPTFFASFLSLLLPAGIFSVVWAKKVGATWNLVTYASVFFGVSAMIGTFSRSGWICLGLTILFMCYPFAKNWRKQSAKSLIRNHSLFFIALILPLVVFFHPISSRLYSYGEILLSGNGVFRLELAKEAALLSLREPITGVGLHYFTESVISAGSSVYDEDPLLTVHNTFLLFFSELGILAGLAWLSFVLYVLASSYKQTQNDFRHMAIWLGACSFLINSQIHTLFSQDPTFDMFMMHAAFLVSLNEFKP